MAVKKETYPGGIQSVQQTALQAPPTQESIDLLTRLLREFERRSYPSSPVFRPKSSAASRSSRQHSSRSRMPSRLVRNPLWCRR